MFRLAKSEVVFKPSTPQLRNTKSPPRYMFKAEPKSETKSNKYQALKTTDQLPEKPADQGIKLTVSYHASVKSMGSYPNEKKQLLTEAERLKRKEVLRQIAKSK